MAYTTIDDPEKHFNTKIYTGNLTQRPVVGLNHQPDFLWFKNRDTALEYLDERTKVFWNKVTDSSVKKSKKQHYKIIVPFYNVQSWISKCIRSLKFQDYVFFVYNLIFLSIYYQDP